MTNNKNNFGLFFEDKTEDVIERAKTKTPVLKEVLKNRINSGKIYPNNLIIEGDNYLALSILTNTYKNSIDLIYIDPPYNTGAKDWKYNNNYIDKKDKYRHSKWLSFMSHRLKLAKDLLKDTGFIICSIDHYELFVLGVLMDKIFGEKNRIGIVTVVHKPEGRNLGKFFSTSTEFMLVYAKNKKQANFNKTILNEELRDRFNLEDKFGRYTLIEFLRKGDGKDSLRENKPAFFYPVYVSKDLKNFSLIKKDDFIEITPTTNKGIDRTWKAKQETFMRLVNNGDIVAKNKKGKLVLYEKLRERELIKTHWDKKEYHGRYFGTKILWDILGSETQFHFCKSLYLILDILKLTTKKDATVLDFFAGSGTTGHAVLEMNKIDGGNRKFILCTNNENGIAESICYPRIKAVIRGYATKSKKVAGIPSNLYYYKVKWRL